MSVHYAFNLVGNQIHVSRTERFEKPDPKRGYEDKAFRDNWTDASQAFKEDLSPKAKPMMIVFPSVDEMHDEMDQVLFFAREVGSIRLIVVDGMEEAMVDRLNSQTQTGKRRIGITNAIPGAARLPFAQSRDPSPTDGSLKAFTA